MRIRMIKGCLIASQKINCERVRVMYIFCFQVKHAKAVTFTVLTCFTVLKFVEYIIHDGYYLGRIIILFEKNTVLKMIIINNYDIKLRILSKENLRHLAGYLHV